VHGITAAMKKTSRCKKKDLMYTQTCVSNEMVEKKNRENLNVEQRPFTYPSFLFATIGFALHLCALMMVIFDRR
jgi:hypothetical protein